MNDKKVKKDVLYAAFEKKGIKPVLAATICDKTPSYFSNCEKNGVNTEVAQKLKDRLGIDIYSMPSPGQIENPEQFAMFTRTDELLVEILAELKKITGGWQHDPE